MNEDIEALVLSGKLFGTNDPDRSLSPDSGWHDEELKHSRTSSHLAPQASDEEGTNDYGSTVGRSRDNLGAHRRPETTAQQQQQQSIGMGPGRTGVKGVIRDRNEALSREREIQRREVEELYRKLEKGNLGGKTYLEEEREKALDPLYSGKVDELVLKEQQQELRGEEEKRRDMFGRRREGRFGHLREVGVERFVDSVEEERGVWVLVHIYDSSLERCEDLDDTLTRLAPLHPDTKFLRARASVLGFACSSRTSVNKREVAYERYIENQSVRINRRYDDDDYDEEKDEDEDEDGKERTAVDLDMLPTLLVYRDGELVHNWVRVDWEAGPTGVEDLLERHQILPHRRIFHENLGFPPDNSDDGDDDDDDDLLRWNDSDGE